MLINLKYLGQSPPLTPTHDHATTWTTTLYSVAHHNPQICLLLQPSSASISMSVAASLRLFRPLKLPNLNLYFQTLVFIL